MNQSFTCNVTQNFPFTRYKIKTFKNRMISLEQFCLRSIAEEFETFYVAATAKSDEIEKNPIRNLLQRKYSCELAEELSKIGEMKEEYLEFLMNEYSNFLDYKWLRNTRYEDSTKEILRRSPNLTKIVCSEITDKVLKNIAKFCPKIVEINAPFSSLTYRGVKYLCKNKNGIVPCPELKKLNIKYIDIPLKGVEHLIRDLNSLEIFKHSGIPSVLYSLHKKDLPKFEKVPKYNLTELDFFREYHLPYYNDILKLCLTACPKLKDLTCTLYNKEQFSLFNNTCLENLRITFPNDEIDKVNVDNLLKNCGCNLVYLCIANCIMSFSNLAVCCPKLEKLVINKVDFSKDSEDSKLVFLRLVSCTFYYMLQSRVNYISMSLLLLSAPNLNEVRFFLYELSIDMKICFLKCCGKSPLKYISFRLAPTNFTEFNFAKNILLNCPYLERLGITCQSDEERKKLRNFADTLLNKPEIL